jgi:hypothetical protein
MDWLTAAATQMRARDRNMATAKRLAALGLEKFYACEAFLKVDHL